MIDDIAAMWRRHKDRQARRRLARRVYQNGLPEVLVTFGDLNPDDGFVKVFYEGDIKAEHVHGKYGKMRSVNGTFMVDFRDAVRLLIEACSE